MAELIVTHRGVVHPWQCDLMGHMNVMWYMGKFDEATWQLFAAVGMTGRFIQEQRRGMAAVEQHLTYHKELRAGDTLEVRSGVVEVRPRVLRVTHRMSDSDGELAAAMELTAVHIDLDTRRAVAFPDLIRERATALS